MISFVPIIGWLVAFVIYFLLAIPFYFLWNAMAPTYLYFLPPVYHQLPFWDCVLLLWLLSIIKDVAMPSCSTRVERDK